MQLLSGGLQDFDVDDLRNNTKYTGGYTESSRTVKLFWEVYVSVQFCSFCINGFLLFPVLHYIFWGACNLVRS
jgi:hypothetical protein